MLSLKLIYCSCNQTKRCFIALSICVGVICRKWQTWWSGFPTLSKHFSHCNLQLSDNKGLKCVDLVSKSGAMILVWVWWCCSRLLVGEVLTIQTATFCLIYISKLYFLFLLYRFTLCTYPSHKHKTWIWKSSDLYKHNYSGSVFFVFLLDCNILSHFTAPKTNRRKEWIVQFFSTQTKVLTQAAACSSEMTFTRIHEEGKKVWFVLHMAATHTRETDWHNYVFVVVLWLEVLSRDNSSTSVTLWWAWFMISWYNLFLT